jgi:hypothetical protein
VTGGHFGLDERTLLDGVARLVALATHIGRLVLSTGFFGLHERTVADVVAGLIALAAYVVRGQSVGNTITASLGVLLSAHGAIVNPI